MLSVSRIRSAGRAADYYGKDDYYVTGEADAPGLRWGGQGAKVLGLQGAATPEEFRAVLSGANPEPGGPALSTAKQDGKHQPGWDLTFSAPKSVSVAILIGGDERLDRAHDRAVRKAMDYAERYLSIARVRQDGRRREVLTGNLLYATTVHGTSREGDPQRHTHVVLANATLDPELGKWRALESLHIYRHRVLIGKIYQAELAKAALALGYDVRRSRTPGAFELDAWSRDQLKVFAKRAEAIAEAFAIERPISAAAKEAVKLKGRPSKIGTPRGELAGRWKAEAERAGLNVEPVVADARARGRGRDRTQLVVGRVSDRLSRLRAALGRRLAWGHASTPYDHQPADVGRDVKARAAVSHALQVSEVRSAVFVRHDVVERALDVAPASLGVDRIDRQLVELAADGRVLAADRTRVGGLTTARSIAMERSVLAAMQQGQGRAAAIIPRIDVLQRLDRAGDVPGGIVLNAGQRSAVASMLSSPDRYTAVQGYAGVGKTTMFRAANQVACEQGWTMTAITPTHRAAFAMEEEAGVHASTIASWLAAAQGAMKTRPGLENLRTHWRDRLLVVDEASMVSNEQMCSIMAAADRIGVTRIVLVGDERQLGSPEAGAPFRLLLNRNIERARITTILRQGDPTLRDSVLLLAQGYAAQALNLIDRHIREVGRDADDTALARAAVSAWRATDRVARIVVPTNALRGHVCDLVRQDLKEVGELGERSQRLERYRSVRLDGPERFRAGSYDLGQRLVFHTAARSVGVPRGHEADVVGLDLRNDVVRVRTAMGDSSLDLRQMGRHRRCPFQAFSLHNMVIAEGETMVWERADAKRGYLTGAAFTVVSMGERFWTIRHEDGRIEQLRADDPALKFSSYGYAETADRAQGQTYASVVAVLGSRHGEAASAARQYVMQSRPSVAFTMVTDDKRMLMMKLGRQDGLNRIALEHVGAAFDRPHELGVGASLREATPAPPEEHMASQSDGRSVQDGKSL